MAKWALITGATGGIGQAVARSLWKEGYNLYLHYHQGEKTVRQLQHHLQQDDNQLQRDPPLQKDIEQKMRLIQADLSVAEGSSSLVRQMQHMPDIFVHCAGRSHYGLVTDVSASDYHSLIHIHLTAPFMITQSILSHMIAQRWGRIVFVSSIWGETGASYETLYSMAKGGLNAFTKALAKEVAPSGVTVNAVSPGAIDTEMMRDFTPAEVQQISADIPLGRLGRPEEVAHAISFLVQEKSAYTTGQILRVNGAWYV